MSHCNFVVFPKLTLKKIQLYVFFPLRLNNFSTVYNYSKLYRNDGYDFGIKNLQAISLPLRWLLLKTKQNKIVMYNDGDVEKLEPCAILLGVLMVQLLWKAVCLVIAQKIQNGITTWYNNTTFGDIPITIESGLLKRFLCSKAALFTIAQTWKQPKCLYQLMNG